jgi:hypothetical protein
MKWVAFLMAAVVTTLISPVIFYPSLVSIFFHYRRQRLSVSGLPALSHHQRQ